MFALKHIKPLLGIILAFNFIRTCDSSCNIPIKNITYNDPLLFKSPGWNLLRVTSKVILHFMEVEDNEEISVVCPGESNFLLNFPQDNNVKFRCKSGEFRRTDDDGLVYKLEEQKCKNFVDNEMVKIENSTTCAKGLSEWVIRFKITESEFLNFITICRDDDERRTQYTFLDMRPDADLKYLLKGPNRPDDFRGDEGTLYSDSVQTLKNLQSRLKKNVDFNEKDNRLSRGHLTANYDVFFAPLSSATFYYYNVAPQWQAFNRMNWQEVEILIRRHVRSLGHDVRVYTGVYGKLFLELKNNGKQYLFLDGEGTKLPVPEYYWRIVDYPNLKTAIVGTNDIFINDITAIQRSHHFCKVTDCPEWLTIKNNTAGWGFIFCCNIDDDFLEKVRVNVNHGLQLKIPSAVVMFLMILLHQWMINPGKLN